VTSFIQDSPSGFSCPLPQWSCGRGIARANMTRTSPLLNHTAFYAIEPGLLSKPFRFATFFCGAGILETWIFGLVPRFFCFFSQI
jgi:hypothetical protein